MTKEKLIAGLLEIITDEKDLQILQQIVNERRFDEQFREMHRSIHFGQEEGEQ